MSQYSNCYGDVSHIVGLEMPLIQMHDLTKNKHDLIDIQSTISTFVKIISYEKITEVFAIKDLFLLLQSL
jgi:hypothetical protein